MATTYQINEVHCIDCIKGMSSLGNQSIDMILCDLPYGTTRNKWDSIIPLDLLWAQYKRIIKPNGAIVLTAQTPFDKVLGASNLAMLRYEWIWQKESGTGFLNAKKMPLKSHENILIFYSQLPVYNPQMTSGKPYTQKQGRGSSSWNYNENYGGHVTMNTGLRYPVSVIRFNRDSGLHPTQKPVALFEYLIKTYTNPGELVLDNCIGSGTTAVAAQRCGRRWIGFEIDEQYCEITRQRCK